MGDLAAKLRARLRTLARYAGRDGITIAEAIARITDHKPTSVSPRFSELVKRGELVRVLTGRGKPTKRSPEGVARYATRLDAQTRKRVIIHWLPEFAPTAKNDVLRCMMLKPPRRAKREVKSRHRKSRTSGHVSKDILS